MASKDARVTALTHVTLFILDVLAERVVALVEVPGAILLILMAMLSLGSRRPIACQKER